MRSPATTVEGRIELPTGTGIHFRRTGQGEPLVLLHGIAHSADAWNPVVPRLAATHEVIALDLPGCGRSDKPDTDYSVEGQAIAVRQALDALGLDLVTAVGHSLGGGIALSLARLYPERVGRLALVSSAGLGRDLPFVFRTATFPVVPKGAMRVLFHPVMRHPRNLAGVAMGRMLRDPFFRHPREHRAEFEDLLTGLEDTAAQRAFLATLRSSSNLAGQSVSALPHLAMARFPVLVVWGRHDRVFPVRHALRLADALPDARLVILEDCGHFPQLEATDEFCAALFDWLTTTKPQRVYTPAVTKTDDTGAPAA